MATAAVSLLASKGTGRMVSPPSWNGDWPGRSHSRTSIGFGTSTLRTRKAAPGIRRTFGLRARRNSNFSQNLDSPFAQFAVIKSDIPLPSRFPRLYSHFRLKSRFSHSANLPGNGRHRDGACDGGSNGSADAGSRQRTDRASDAPIQKADRTERDAERTARAPILRKAVRTAPPRDASQAESRPQSPRPRIVEWTT